MTEAALSKLVKHTNNQETPTKSQLDNNGGEVSDFMKRVQAKIARNEAQMRKLGLSPDKTSLKRSASPKKKTKSVTPQTPVRRSDRVSKKPPVFAAGLEDHPHAQYEKIRSRRRLLSPKKKAKLRRTITPEEPIDLSECDEKWLEQFGNFLHKVDEISSDNQRSVLKQVRKLIAGQGITYHHWPKGTVFAKGVKLTPQHDLESLYEEAVDYEDAYGRDLGNGWLMRHPIKKMILYQDYCRIHSKGKKSTLQK